MIVELIQKLPNYVEYKGYSFKFELLKNGSKEIRICYSLDSYIGHSLRKINYFEEFKSWKNPLINSTCDFLFLYENIESDTDLIWALKDLYYQLLRLNLL